MEKNKLLKVLVPALMICIVAGIWFTQNSADQKTQSSDIPADFALNASSIDLDALKKYELPIIIDFGANECIPCKEMAPILVSLNEEFQEEAIIKFVDVWENPTASSGYPVQVIPTQVLYNSDGSAYMPSDEVANQISFQLYAHKDTNEHIFTVHQGGLTESQLRTILMDMGVN